MRSVIGRGPPQACCVNGSIDRLMSAGSNSKRLQRTYAAQPQLIQSYIARDLGTRMPGLTAQKD